MAARIPAEAWQLRSLVRADQTLELSLDTVPIPEPGPNEVLIRIEATPINPSDLGSFLGKIGLEGMLRLRERVAAGLKTTFASTYTAEVSLPGRWP
jgi:NADPH:quinone reductase-like Zn-dependent oxidoreductase